jgi:hypothetical protein
MENESGGNYVPLSFIMSLEPKTSSALARLFSRDSQFANIFMENTKKASVQIRLSKFYISHAIIFLLILIFFRPLALWPNAGHGHLILEFSRSHITTHHIR